MYQIMRRYLLLLIVAGPTCLLLVRLSGPNVAVDDPLPDPMPLTTRLQTKLVALEQETAQLRELNFERALQIRQLTHAVGNRTGTGTGPIGTARLPSLADFLDLEFVAAPEPMSAAFRRVGPGGPRRNATFVFGLPTIRRAVKSYLLATLVNLVHHMSEQEKAESVIVVMIAEPWDLDFVRNQTAEIESRLPGEVHSGLIEVIAPPKQFYPDLEHLRKTLGDPEDRVKWRTKQNLDFAFLMNYCRDRGIYYVQLEDDIIARRDFVTTMKNVALRKSVEIPDWFIIEFCGLGFIGKMFKARELKYLVFYLVMFRNEKPCDWLLLDLAHTKFCAYIPKFNCDKEIAKFWLRHGQALFQHVGLHSSLKGKLQKLVDKRFNKALQYVGHADNPAAHLNHSLSVYQTYGLERLYNDRNNFFWSLEPKSGDFIQFTFERPLKIRSLLIRSGTDQHPEDLFDPSTTLSVRERSPFKNPADYQFSVVARSDDAGVLRAEFEPPRTNVDAVRIDFTKHSSRWLAISEISFEIVS